MAADQPAVELALPDRRGTGARIEWNPERVRSLADGDQAPESPWELRGEIAWEEVSALRVVSVALGDGSLLAIASLRPRGPDGHDVEVVRGIVIHGEEIEPLGEVLLSTEYDPAGLPRRIGAEIRSEADAAPLRLAGDRDGEASATGEEVAHETVPMRFRLAGGEGRGLHERVLRRG